MRDLSLGDDIRCSCPSTEATTTAHKCTAWPHTRVGHELAHANLGHLDKRRANQFSDGPAERQSMPVLCLVEYRPVGPFPDNLTHAGERAFSVNSSARPTMSAPICAPGPATNLPERRNSGGHFRWKVLTAFVSPRTIRLRLCVSCRCRKSRAEIADKQRRNAPLDPELTALSGRTNMADRARNPHDGATTH